MDREEVSGRGVTLELTHGCNYGCRYCTCRDTEEDPLPPERWVRIIRDLTERRGAERIRFAGGEPMRHPFLADLIAAAKDAGAETVLATNGSMADGEFLESVSDSLDELELTVGSSEESGEIALGRHARGVDHLKRTEELSAQARSLGIKVVLDIAVTRRCLGDDFAELADRVSADSVRFVRIGDGPHTGDVRRFAVTDMEFAAFLDRNSGIGNVASVPEYALRIAPDGRVVTEGAEGPITVSYRRYWNEGFDLEDVRTDIRESRFYRNTVRPFVDRFRSFITMA